MVLIVLSLEGGFIYYYYRIILFVVHHMTAILWIDDPTRGARNIPRILNL